MTIPTNPMESFTPFLPTTFNIPEEEDRLKTFLVDEFSAFADVINDKKIGVITQESENFSGGKYFYKTTAKTRNEYQTVIFIQSLPNTGVLTLTLTSVPAYPIKDVNPEFVITPSFGTASKPPSATGAGDGDFFTFTNQGDTRISWTMSDNTIVITTTVDLSAYIGLFVINYIRNGI